MSDNDYNQIFWERVALTALPVFLGDSAFTVDEAVGLAITCADMLLGARQERMNAKDAE
jgi:hypothetical protein